MGTKADSVRLCPDYTEDLIVMAKMWAGRFLKEENEKVNDFNSSISFDSRMYRHDIMGSLSLIHIFKWSWRVRDAVCRRIHGCGGRARRLSVQSAF